jgi:hypothetical protein
MFDTREIDAVLNNRKTYDETENPRTHSNIAIVHDIEKNVYRMYNFIDGKWQYSGTKTNIDGFKNHVLVSREKLENIISTLKSGSLESAITQLEELFLLSKSDPPDSHYVIQVDDTIECTTAIIKKRRKPNKYNMFVSETMKSLAKERTDLTSKQCMTVAVQMWKNRPE